MTRIWRICKRPYAPAAFTGEGARKFGGRWHQAGIPIVYCSTTRALAALEILVHVDIELVPLDFVLIPADVPDELVKDLPSAGLPSNWRDIPAPDETRAIGQKWFVERSSVALRVPSVVIPEESNVLLNPAHPDFAHVVTGEAVAFQIDPRLSR